MSTNNNLFTDAMTEKLDLFADFGIAPISPVAPANNGIAMEPATTSTNTAQGALWSDATRQRAPVRPHSSQAQPDWPSAPLNDQSGATQRCDPTRRPDSVRPRTPRYMRPSTDTPRPEVSYDPANDATSIPEVMGSYLADIDTKCHKISADIHALQRLVHAQTRKLDPRDLRRKWREQRLLALREAHLAMSQAAVQMRLDVAEDHVRERQEREAQK